MGAISLLAVDLDGTLLTAQKQLAVEGAQRLSQLSRAGVRVVLTTARNPETVRQFCQQMDLHDAIICTNGAQIWATPDGPVWVSLTIPQVAAAVMAQLADQNNWELIITVGEVSYWRQRPGQLLGEVKPNRIVVARNCDMLTGDPVRIAAFEPSAIAALRELCLTEFAGQCHSEIFVDPAGVPDSLGIFPRGADKGTALRYVLEQYDLQASAALALGDNFTDLAMFKVAGHSVAMGNASDEVKRQATLVAPTNDEEGVAWAIEWAVRQNLL